MMVINCFINYRDLPSYSDTVHVEVTSAKKRWLAGDDKMGMRMRTVEWEWELVYDSIHGSEDCSMGVRVTVWEWEYYYRNVELSLAMVVWE